MGAGRSRLAALTQDILEANVKNIDAVLFDCDGVLWRGAETLPGAIDLTNTLLKLGKQVGYVTNNSSRTHEQTVEELKKRGFPTPNLDLVICTSRSTSLYLAEKKPNSTAFRVGNAAVAAELKKVGIESWTSDADETVPSLMKKGANFKVDSVIVSLDREFNYNRMAVAAHLLHTNKGALFVATNTDPTFPEAGGRLSPGCGSIVAAVSTAAGRDPDVIIGKPYATMFEQVRQKLNLEPQRVLIVGDRCDTDMGFASTIGATSLFVLTGAETLDDAKAYLDPQTKYPNFAPNYYLESVFCLNEMLLKFD